MIRWSLFPLGLVLYGFIYLFFYNWITTFHTTLRITSVVGVFLPYLGLLLLVKRKKKSVLPMSVKRVWQATLFAGLLPVLFLYVMLGMNQYESIFQQGRWMNSLEKRIYMVDHLLSEHPLQGLTKEETLKLLGQPSSKGNYKSPDSFVYHLGTKQSLFAGIDGTVHDESLVIGFNEQNIVDHYFFLINQ